MLLKIGGKHTKILDEQFSTFYNFGMASKQRVSVLDGLFGHGIKDTNAVVVRNFGSACHDLLRVIDGSIVWYLNGRRKSLQALSGPIGDFQSQACHFELQQVLLVSIEVTDTNFYLLDVGEGEIGTPVMW